MKPKGTRRAKSAPPLTAFGIRAGSFSFACLSSNLRRPAKWLGHSRQVVWWATAVEATSAFQRLAREEVVTTKEIRQALTRLDYLRARWNEV